MWIEGILGVAGIVLIASGLIAAGRSVLQLLAPHSVRPELPHRMLAAGLGIAMLSTGILGLGMAGLLYHSVLAVLIGAVGALGAWEIIRRLRAVVAAPERPGWVAAVAVAAVALPALPYLLLPPLARDALVYHLEVPRQYLLHHGLIELPQNVYAYFPKGIEMLFTAALGLFPPWATQFVHCSFLALTVLAVLEYAAAIGRQAPRPLWLPAVLAFVTVPTLWLDATSAYIDAGLMFFIALTALGLDWHHRRGDPALLGVSLLLAGFVVAIKYTAFYFVLALLSVYLVSVLARRRTADLAWRHPVWLGAGLLVFAGPYFAWNAWHTGNPVFPFFGGLFPNSNPFWTQAQADAFWGFLASYGHPFHFPLAPALNYLVAAFNPVLHLREFFDGVLGPFLLIGVLAVLPARKRNSSEALTGCFVVVVALVWGILLRQARFLLPVLPLLLLMLIQALEGWWGERPWRRAVWVAVCLGVIAFNLAVLLPELARQPALELVSSRTTREDILNTRLPVYACQRYINRELPPDARIWTLQTGNELFYLDRAYLGDYVVEDHTFHTWLAEACEPSAITNRFAHYGVTHLLIRTDAVFAPELYTDIPDKYLVMRAFSDPKSAFVLKPTASRCWRCNRRTKLTIHRRFHKMAAMHPPTDVMPVSPFRVYWRGAILFAAVALSALPTCSNYGITWDEPIYLEATRQVRTWLSLPAAARFNTSAIDRFWRTDPQRNVHPAGVKWLYLAAQRLVFWEQDPYMQSRMLTAILFAVALAAFCMWFSAGRPLLAWTTAALFLTMPRCFAHSHFAATDIPMIALLLLLIPALDRGLSPQWAWIPGVLIGLAACFKITTVVVCAPMLALFLVCTSADWKQCIARLWIVGLTAAIVFYLLNPDWWHAPWVRLGEFVGESVSRRQWTPFSLLYFGQVYSYRGPFHYPLGILLVTTPLLHLGLLAAGMFRLRLRPLLVCCRHWAVLIGSTVPVILMMVPFSPTNDMERYLLPAFPFLAAWMALGLQPALERFLPAGQAATPVAHRATLAVILILAAGWTISQSIRNHPRELSYFNEWVGGTAGGRSLGFEVTYWWEPLDDDALAAINRICRGSTVFFPISPTDHYFRQMQQMRRIDFIPVTDLGQARHVLVYGRPYAEFWESKLRTRIQPAGYEMVMVWSSEWQGVPLLRLWRIQPMAVPPSPREDAGDGSHSTADSPT